VVPAPSSRGGAEDRRRAEALGETGPVVPSSRFLVALQTLRQAERTPPDVRLPFVFQAESGQVWAASEAVHFSFAAGTVVKSEIIMTGASSPVCNAADVSLGGYLKQSP
jgi:hypothetical protein